MKGHPPLGFSSGYESESLTSPFLFFLLWFGVWLFGGLVASVFFILFRKGHWEISPWAWGCLNWLGIASGLDELLKTYFILENIEKFGENIMVGF
jgi:hypothetical protein